MDEDERRGGSGVRDAESGREFSPGLVIIGSISGDIFFLGRRVRDEPERSRGNLAPRERK